VRVSEFDFDLPEELIALEPAAPRDSARLLRIDPAAAPPFSHHVVRDLPRLLRHGDALVLNDTRVIPAELDGMRLRGEARAGVSFNLARRLDGHRWQALARPAKRLAVGDRILIGETGRVCYAAELAATVEAKGEGGLVTLAFDLAGAVLDEAIAERGRVPLPPYIASRRAAVAADKASYQTIYARHEGAVAAPTAGLHFTPDLFSALDAAGISRHTVTLHVGAGTFLPVKADDTEDHVMHAEWGEVGTETVAALEGVRSRGGRIVAVGSTSLRLLEAAAGPDGRLRPFSGETALFIAPGYRFGVADMLLTNFHLPRSTLFMLVAAFSGLEVMRAAYAEAIASRYRFYSYGDACLLSRAEPRP
jgi:S-adenosylmethionine:tRNA ribosyltransferase-isomerase